MSKRIRVAVGLAVSLVFLTLILFRVNLGEVWSALAHADYSWIALAVPVYFVGVWLRALRWQYLASPVKALSAGRLFSYVVLGFMANNVLPLRVGELVRAYLLGEKEKVSKTSILATILVERVLDALTLLFFALAVSLFVPLPEELRTGVLLVGLAFLAALVVSLGLAYFPDAALAITGLLVRLLPEHLRDRAQSIVGLFLGGLGSLRQGRTLARVSLLSVAIWLVETGVFVLVGNGFRLVLPFYGYLLAMSAANLGISIPSSQGGIGPFEGLVILTLSEVFGQEISLATAYAFVVHATLLIPVIILGLVYLWRGHLSLKAIAERRPEGVGEVA